MVAGLGGSDLVLPTRSFAATSLLTGGPAAIGENAQKATARLLVGPWQWKCLTPEERREWVRDAVVYSAPSSSFGGRVILQRRPEWKYVKPMAMRLVKADPSALEDFLSVFLHDDSEVVIAGVSARICRAFMRIRAPPTKPGGGQERGPRRA